MSSNIQKNITECIGQTPLVQLNRIAGNAVATIAAKLESHNPLGSVKDRIGRAMIDAAEREGQAPAGHNHHRAHQRQHGHRPGLRLCGAGLQAHGDDAGEHEPGAAAIAQGAGGGIVLDARGRRHGRGRAASGRLGSSDKRFFMPQQFKNPANPEIHRKTTAEEIWRDTDGQVDIFVAGVGTGGTITGVGEVLKKRKPDMKIVAVEPAVSSVITQHRNGQPLRPGKHSIQGIGAGFIPDILNINVIDEVITVADDDAIETSQQLARLDGFMCGVSSGAAGWAAIQVATRPENRGKLVVVVLPDLGERYLSTKLFPE